MTNAARLCDAIILRGLYIIRWRIPQLGRRNYGYSPEVEIVPFVESSAPTRDRDRDPVAALERRIVNVPDILTASEFAEYQTGGRQDRERAYELH